jgi:hypothetical protein
VYCGDSCFDFYDGDIKMNERIRQLALQAMTYVTHNTKANKLNSGDMFDEKFAELIVEECRNVVSDVYRKTPLEICGPLLTADEEIAKHFYGVEE